MIFRGCLVWREHRRNSRSWEGYMLGAWMNAQHWRIAESTTTFWGPKLWRARLAGSSRRDGVETNSGEVVRSRSVAQEFTHGDPRGDFSADAPPLVAAKFLFSLATNRRIRGWSLMAWDVGWGVFRELYIELLAEDPRATEMRYVGRPRPALNSTRDAPLLWHRESSGFRASRLHPGVRWHLERDLMLGSHVDDLWVVQTNDCIGFALGWKWIRDQKEHSSRTWRCVQISWKRNHNFGTRLVPLVGWLELWVGVAWPLSKDDSCRCEPLKLENGLSGLPGHRGICDLSQVCAPELTDTAEDPSLGRVLGSSPLGGCPILAANDIEALVWRDSVVCG